MPAIVEKEIVDGAVHVFVIGVSRYLHLEDGIEPTQKGADSGLRQLTSAARSASDIAGWALENIPGDKLASLYVHLAPAPDEELHEEIRNRIGDDPSARRDDVVADWVEFHERCFARRNATVIVYTAGHGVQIAKEGAILMLEDFGKNSEPVFWGALDLVEMHKSFQGDEAAAHQFWFIDCCRDHVDAADYGFDKLRFAYCGFDVPEGNCKAAPIFFAAMSREKAWARRGGTSLFCAALLEALRGDAAVEPQSDKGPWCVTTSGLIAVVSQKVKLASGTAEQEVFLAGLCGTTTEVIFEFPEPPEVSMILTLDPTEAQSGAVVDIELEGMQVVGGARDWPVVRDLPAGLYIVDITPESPFQSARRGLTLTPQRAEHKIAIKS